MACNPAIPTQVKKEPVPYKSGVEIPPLRVPYPMDAHLVKTKDVIFKKAATPYAPDASLSSHSGAASKSAPWATFQKTEPSVFAGGQSAEPSSSPSRGSPDGKRPLPDKKEQNILLTRYMEWELQRSNYNPSIAAQMRCEAGHPPRDGPPLCTRHPCPLLHSALPLTYADILHLRVNVKKMSSVALEVTLSEPNRLEPI